MAINKIILDDIEITSIQRSVMPHTLQDIIGSMKAHGYNPAYPIVIDQNNKLVDGGHRLEAAKKNGIKEIPFIYKPKNVTHVQYAMQCNDDRGLGRPDDVFDIAEYCWKLAEDGMSHGEIAKEMGWSEKASVTNYKKIKTHLHPLAWALARNPSLANKEGLAIANGSLAIANETHFRAIFPHLTHNQNKPDHTIYRAQLKTINAALTTKKLTAKWIGTEAQKHSWHAELARHMRDNIAERAPLSDRKTLLKNIYSGVFGSKDTDDNRAKFERALSAINENVLGVTLYQGDSFQKIPELKDGSIALVVTDPPYNVTANEWDKIGTDEQYIEFIANFLDVLRPKLADNYHLFMSISPQYQARIETLLVSKGWPIKSRIVWSHRNLSKGRDVTDKFICMWEMVFHCGSHPLNWPESWNDERFEVQEWAAPQSNFEDKKEHPTQKPLGLFELFVKVGSSPGDIILDPFAGGGTTGAACKSIEQRQCVLIEQDDKYCEAIEKRLGVKRWQG